MHFVVTVEGTKHPIRREGLSIGRGPGNTVALADRQASRHHARIWLRGQHPHVQDTGSRNGTFVNGERISTPRPLQPGDQVRVGCTTLTLEAVRSPRLASDHGPLLVLLLILGGVLVVGLFVSLTTAPRRAWAPATLVPPLRTAERLTPTSPLAGEVDVLERARLATVLIVAYDAYGQQINGGSGSMVDPEGYILTNLHVVDDGDTIMISTNAPDQNAPPRMTYQARLVDADTDLDLALLRLVSWHDGRPLPASLGLQAVPIGDSNSLQIGDAVTIMGFPEVGGETLTLTRGTVAGFHEDSWGHSRGWIKTDAEISPGNSGGTAINAAGELIGVPTFVSAEARTLGRIGGLRPINLAAPLLRGMQ